MNDEVSLKLELQTIKEQFVSLLQTFESYELKKQPEWVTPTLPPPPTTRRQHARRAPSHRHSFKRPSYVDSDKSVELSQVNYSLSPTKHRGMSESKYSRSCSKNRGRRESNYSPTKQRGLRESTSIGSTIQTSVRDISNITKYSMTSLLTEQSSTIMIDGPLQSTMDYPQHSTPEKMSPADMSDIFEENTGNVARQLYCSSVMVVHSKVAEPSQPDIGDRMPPTGTHYEVSDERLPPCGIDNAHNTPPHTPTIPLTAILPLQHMHTSANDSEDKTPVVTPVGPSFMQRRAQSDARSFGEDSGLFAGSPTVTDGSESRDMYLSGAASDVSLLASRLQDDSDSGRESLPKRLRRQPGQGELQHQQPRHLVGISDTDLALAHATSVEPCHLSLHATRDSLADASGLTSPTSQLGATNSDLSLSDRHYTSLSSCIGSSYKESDTNSSAQRSIYSEDFSFKLPPVPYSSMIATSESSIATHDASYLPAPYASVMSSMYYSTSDSNLGIVAPMNSPNVSSASRPTTDSLLESSDAGNQASRPPCIGREIDDCPTIKRRPPRPHVINLVPGCRGVTPRALLLQSSPTKLDLQELSCSDDSTTNMPHSQSRSTRSNLRSRGSEDSISASHQSNSLTRSRDSDNTRSHISDRSDSMPRPKRSDSLSRSQSSDISDSMSRSQRSDRSQRSNKSAARSYKSESISREENGSSDEQRDSPPSLRGSSVDAGSFPITPSKATPGVKRSLSKRIKNFGKNIFKGHFKNKSEQTLFPL